jgi:hypothetical protein
MPPGYSHALAYNLANFLRTLALPREVADWSLMSLHEKVVKIGAKVVAHGRYLVFQMAEVAVPRELFRGISTGSPGCARRGGPVLTREGPAASPVAGLAYVQGMPGDRPPGPGAAGAPRIRRWAPCSGSATLDGAGSHTHRDNDLC